MGGGPVAEAGHGVAACCAGGQWCGVACLAFTDGDADCTVAEAAPRERVARWADARCRVDARLVEQVACSPDRVAQGVVAGGELGATIAVDEAGEGEGRLVGQAGLVDADVELLVVVGVGQHDELEVHVVTLAGRAAAAPVGVLAGVVQAQGRDAGALESDAGVEVVGAHRVGVVLGAAGDALEAVEDHQIVGAEVVGVDDRHEVVAALLGVQWRECGQAQVGEAVELVAAADAERLETLGEVVGGVLHVDIQDAAPGGDGELGEGPLPA